MTSEDDSYGFLGIGLDSCIIPTRHKDIKLVQTTDFFYPLVDDPYMQGKIACANVLSDLYATGISNCDNMLMLLGVSTDLSALEREVVTKLVIQGFKDLAKEAGTTINGGQTVLNPWFIIGGVATSISNLNEIILPNGAVVNDLIVLTKPIGTQVAVNAHQWLHKPERWVKIEQVTSEEEVEVAYQKAMANMARLNRNAAILMHKYNAHAATDITGFGILGHAKNLAKSQKLNVDFLIHTLPIIKNMFKIFLASGVNFKLTDGYSPETSGGLFVCLPKENAHAYCDELKALDGYDSWIIGEVVSGNKDARIIDDKKIIEV